MKAIPDLHHVAVTNSHFKSTGMLPGDFDSFLKLLFLAAGTYNETLKDKHASGTGQAHHQQVYLIPLYWQQLRHWYLPWDTCQWWNTWWPGSPWYPRLKSLPSVEPFHPHWNVLWGRLSWFFDLPWPSWLLPWYWLCPMALCPLLGDYHLSPHFWPELWFWWGRLPCCSDLPQPFWLLPWYWICLMALCPLFGDYHLSPHNTLLLHAKDFLSGNYPPHWKRCHFPTWLRTSEWQCTAFDWLTLPWIRFFGSTLTTQYDGRYGLGARHCDVNDLAEKGQQHPCALTKGVGMLG